MDRDTYTLEIKTTSNASAILYQAVWSKRQCSQELSPTSKQDNLDPEPRTCTKTAPYQGREVVTNWHACQASRPG